MTYLTDRRGDMRADPRSLLPSARAVVCVGRLYNQPGSGTVARYARGEDYHDVLRRDLERMASGLRAAFGDFEYKICVDTAPLLERSYARAAGLGWIGRNTCLINQQLGSYLFLAEILVSLPLEPAAAGGPAPDRCGTCRRCIDACPTDAIAPGGLRTELDATRCISYLTIELKGDLPENLRAAQGTLVFGCDICQEVCPWNRRAPFVDWPGALPAGDIDSLAALSPDEFRERFRKTPVWRTKYQGLLRNVAVALGNSSGAHHRDALERLAASDDEVVRRHAEWALARVPREAAV
jgi:epoxyqueuosine reductase